MTNKEFTSETIILENDRARLEPLQEKHVEVLLPIALHPELWLFTGAKIRDEKTFRDYFNTALLERESGIAYPFAIFDKQHNGYGGCTRFGNIALGHKRVEIGWTWYLPALQQTGLNRACKFLLLQYGFETLQLNRIELKTSLYNIKSQNAIQKIGATREGVLRKHSINDDGTVRDTVYYSIINDEWPQIRNTIFKGY